MAAIKYYFLFLSVIFSWRCVASELNLNEGDACVSNDVNGTCLDLLKCTSTAITNMYTEAGYGNDFCHGNDCFPAMPEVCSSNGKRPVVCCTDCGGNESKEFRRVAVGPRGVLIDLGDSLAKAKCYDFFKRLPYPCRGKGNVKLKKVWDEEKQCHALSLENDQAVGGRDATRWEFPHMALIGFGDVVKSAQWLCGGSVISERFILTAAHCSSTRDACVSNDVNGTCLDLLKCQSTAITNMYTEAGYGNDFCHGNDCFPAMPEVCSSNGKRPVVCCTDCGGNESKEFRRVAVGPRGVLTDLGDSLAKAKCYDFFKRLPYPCRGKANVKLKKVWDEEKQCHALSLENDQAVGGRDATRWEFPHMALIGFGDDVKSAQWLCGGSVISERFILTAAHCSSTRALGSIKYAALGLLKRTDEPENWKVYNIKRIVIHPEYKSPSKYHDITLLETETEITFGPDLLPACLDVDKKSIFSAEASGWGRLGHRQGLADNLQVVNLLAYNETQCSRTFQPHRHLKQGYDHMTQMCFGSDYDVVNTCEGDSGGPLQTNKIKCLYTVVGVTSFGKNCGVLGSPGMYTRVSHYVPWIESVVWPGETNNFD